MTKKVKLNLGGSSKEYDFTAGVGIDFKGKEITGTQKVNVGVFAVGTLPQDGDEHDVLGTFLPVAISSFSRQFTFARQMKEDATMAYISTLPGTNDDDNPAGHVMECVMFTGTPMSSDGTGREDIMTGVMGVFENRSHLIDHAMKLLEHILDSEPDALNELASKCYMLFAVRSGMSKEDVLGNLKKALTLPEYNTDEDIAELFKKIKDRG